MKTNKYSSMIETLSQIHNLINSINKYINFEIDHQFLNLIVSGQSWSRYLQIENPKKETTIWDQLLATNNIVAYFLVKEKLLAELQIGTRPWCVQMDKVI